MSQSKIANRHSAIVSNILFWYRRHGRDLPWRNEHNPYRVLVSEIMLQQTQVSRVLVKYPEFLKRFPTLKALAKARTFDVIRAWQGMGYNNRSIRLQKIAKLVIEEQRGKLPMNIADLQKLPGIGRYTAHAVACFAFGKQVPVVDTNIIRVLSRLFPGKLKKDDSKPVNIEKLWSLAEFLLPKRHAFSWNQALMDLGATICTSANPKCYTCPVSRKCPSAFKTNRRSPVKNKQEPGRNGIPNRIYRGRIVEVLRNLNGQRSIKLTSLGKKIKPNFSAGDERWLERLAMTLETDGLVALRKNGTTTRVTLPA